MKTKEIALVAWLAGFIMGSILWIYVCTIGMRNAAISAKVAEYIVDKTTGEVTFVWLTPKNP